MDLNEENVKACIQKHGGRITNKQLTAYFKGNLTEEAARQKFKKMVSKLATYEKEATGEYLVLKAKYRMDNPLKTPRSSDADGLQSSILKALGSLTSSPSSPANLGVMQESPPHSPEPSDSKTLASKRPESDPDISKATDPEESSDPIHQSVPLPAIHLEPAEETAHSDAEVQTPAEEAVEPFMLKTQYSSEPVLSREPDQDEQTFIHVDSRPASAAETTLSHDFNRVNFRTDYRTSTPVIPRVKEKVEQRREEERRSEGVRLRRREEEGEGRRSGRSRESGEEPRQSQLGTRRQTKDKCPDSVSWTSAGPLSEGDRQWLLQTAECRMSELSLRLASDPEQVDVADYINGYTALHWAAKFGNIELIDLLVGTYKANVGKKTHGGYTPLHIAAIHRQKQAYRHLYATYGASSKAIDNSGRTPEFYLKDPFRIRKLRLPKDNQKLVRLAMRQNGPANTRSAASKKKGKTDWEPKINARGSRGETDLLSPSTAESGPPSPFSRAINRSSRFFRRPVSGLADPST